MRVIGQRSSQLNFSFLVGQLKRLNGNSDWKIGRAENFNLVFV
jgi:hypothetical protein